MREEKGGLRFEAAVAENDCLQSSRAIQNVANLFQ